jgi:hypothetical protein
MIFANNNWDNNEIFCTVGNKSGHYRAVWPAAFNV